MRLRIVPCTVGSLTCNFQGLTNDGKYYVAARLAITHPSLPKGIDFIADRSAERNVNLKKEEKLLNSFTEDSFQPSLKSLKALIASITTIQLSNTVTIKIRRFVFIRGSQELYRLCRAERRSGNRKSNPSSRNRRDTQYRP